MKSKKLSKRSLKNSSVPSKSKNNGRTIGIIGGTGMLGKTFKEPLEEKGFNVLVSSRKTRLTSRELVKKSDIVIFSVPIDSTVKVIRSVLPYTRKNQLLMDFTSIKSFPVKEMLRSSSAVIGAHPMFGKVESIKGKKIILTPARSDGWLNEIREIFHSLGMEVKISSVKKHDKAMALLQGLMHFNYLTGSMTLKKTSEKFGMDFSEIVDYGGLIYELRYGMMARVLSQNPEMYSEISLSNPLVKEVSKEYLKSVKKLHKIIKKQDRKSFVNYFYFAGKVFGSFKEKALKDTTKLFELFSDMENKFKTKNKKWKK